MFEFNMLVKAFIVATAVAVGAASTLYFKMKPDNEIEQVAEFVIKEETGIDADLSILDPDEAVVVLTKAK